MLSGRGVIVKGCAGRPRHVTRSTSAISPLDASPLLTPTRGAHTVGRVIGSRATRDPMVVASLLVLALVAWMVSIRVMDGMAMDGRYALGAPVAFLSVWVLMMAAMMFPSVWPAVIVHGRLLGRRADRGRPEPGRGTAFVSGYLLSWALYGALAFSVVAVVRHSLSGLSDPDLARYVVAPIALVGAVYQAAPLKRFCLDHCRAPMFWLMEHWREGVRGSLMMGVQHGGFCVGCCWLLMALMVAAGAMSITWMALIAIAIALEKLVPIPPWVASGLIAAGFLTVAVVAVADPSLLPGFSDSGGSMSM
jgi:predicted metal-binding membrane protein